MIAGVLLAAGESTRFGSHKLLQHLPDDTPLILAALHALRAGVDEIITVVRPNDAALVRLLAKEKTRIVVCADANRGMGASLACGVRASPTAEGWLVALGDMPFVPTGIITSLAQQLRAGAGIVAPSHTGQRGHPVGFARTFFRELSQLDGDTGARDIIAAHENQLTLLPCANPGILRDVDTPGDLPSASSRG